jgi:hypothetical protein
MFLLLFSYVLLLDLDKTFTPAIIALIVWVADIAFDEVRQVCSCGR